MSGTERSLVSLILSKVENQDELVENLEQQMNEVEMLEAMFANPGEFALDEPNLLDDCKSWLRAASLNKVDFVPPRLAFSIRIELAFGADQVQIYVQFPHEYPSSEKPEVFVKSEKSLNRDTQAQLNEQLSLFMAGNLNAGEMCALEIISWLQDNITEYVAKTKEQAKTKSSSTNTSSVKKVNDKFMRFWIYSHHIYSKIKRRDILDLSKEFNLTGFSMPGKPGIICLEGTESNVNDAWSVIKSWNWKKINVKVQESEEQKKDDDRWTIDKCRRFKSFEEIGFVKGGETRDYHMDMGEFHKFLEQHNCGYMFKELFGISK